eukprot:gene690-378_t
MLQVRHYYSIVSLPTVHKEAAEVVSWLSLCGRFGWHSGCWHAPVSATRSDSNTHAIRMDASSTDDEGIVRTQSMMNTSPENSAEEFSTAAASQQQTRVQFPWPDRDASTRVAPYYLISSKGHFQSVPLADPQWYITLIAFQYRRLLPNRMSIYHPIACFYVGFALRGGGGEGGIRCSNGSTYLILPKGLREHVPPKASAVGRAVPKGAGNRAELLRRQDLSSRRRMWLFFPGALSTAMQSTALMGIPTLATCIPRCPRNIVVFLLILFSGEEGSFCLIVCLFSSLNITFELISDNLRTIFGSTVSSCCNDTQLRQDQLIKKILLYSTRAKHKTIPATQPCKKVHIRRKKKARYFPTTQ